MGEPTDEFGVAVDFEGMLRRLHGLLGESVSVHLKPSSRGGAFTTLSASGQLTYASDVLEGVPELPPRYRGSITFRLAPGGSFSVSPHDFLEAWWTDSEAPGEGESLLLLLRDGSALMLHGPGWPWPVVG